MIKYIQLCFFECLSIFMLGKEQLEFEPGSAYQYSNNGFVLLAMVGERVSGQAYEAFVKQKVFNKVFDRSPATRILTPVQVAGRDQNYGLGWGILNREEECYAGHMGGMLGFWTLMSIRSNTITP